jgi:hypothetical protein
VLSVEGVVGTSVAAGEGEETVGVRCRVGESVGRGVTVAVSCGCGCEGGVARCKGVAVIAGGAPGVWRNCGVGLTVGDGTNSRAGLAVVRGLPRRNDTVGEAIAAAAGILGDGADGVCCDCAGGLATGLENGGDVSAVARVGLTRVFGGASGGGVASDLIFARAFSAACRSAIPSQPRSTTVCATVSLIFRGRSAGCAVAITGAGI